MVRAVRCLSFGPGLAEIAGDSCNVSEIVGLGSRDELLSWHVLQSGVDGQDAAALVFSKRLIFESEFEGLSVPSEIAELVVGTQSARRALNWLKWWSLTRQALTESARKEICFWNDYVIPTRKKRIRRSTTSTCTIQSEKYSLLFAQSVKTRDLILYVRTKCVLEIRECWQGNLRRSLIWDSFCVKEQNIVQSVHVLVRIEMWLWTNYCKSIAQLANMSLRTIITL